MICSFRRSGPEPACVTAVSTADDLHKWDAHDGGSARFQFSKGLRVGRTVVRSILIAGVVAGLAGCGTTIDLTSSQEPVSPAQTTASALSSAQLDLRKNVDQLETTPWTQTSSEGDWMGVFASVLVNGVQTPEGSVRPQSQAELYLAELTREAPTQEQMQAAVRGDLDEKLILADRFVLAARRVLNQYSSQATGGTAFGGDLFRQDLQQARILQKDLLAQMRSDARLIAEGFEALRVQKDVFHEAAILLGLNPENGAGGSTASAGRSIPVLLTALDLTLGQVADLGQSFDGAIASGEAELARLAQSE